MLSDVDRRVGLAYGVARDEDDKYAAFPRRLSYLIDPEGIVRRAYRVSDVASHSAEVLEDLRELQAG